MSQPAPPLDVPGLAPELVEFYRRVTDGDHHARADAKKALALLRRWRGPVADASDVRALYERHVDGGAHSG